MSIVSGVGSPGTVGPASGGKVYAFNVLSDTIPEPVAPPNPSRRKITFHNPGDVDLLVYPGFQITSGFNQPLVVTPTNRGGGFLVYANGGTLIIDGECQEIWYAISVSGSGKPITVMDSNI